MQDLKYRDFHSRLMPGIDKETIIGIRTPILRKFTKEFARTPGAEEFLTQLPHRYYEENNMHMMIITSISDYETCLAEIQRFLPYINNWATCDFPAPKCFARHLGELLSEIQNWIVSGETYTVRYGIGMLMRLYLDDAFQPEYLEMAANITSEEYYVNMMIIWQQLLQSNGLQQFHIWKNDDSQNGYTEKRFKKPLKATGSHQNRKSI